MAARTPAERNRYVDFLRAISILAVVVGHWLIAAPYTAGGELRGVNMLAHTAWTQWLTWVFQVMPVFFAVGGYSNAASWHAARRAGRGYGDWLTSRLRRLTTPLIPLLLAWAGIGMGASALGIDQDLLRLASQSALVPVWFLAVYVLVVAVSPLLIAAWDRAGWGSFLLLAGGAAIVDAAVAHGWTWLGWANFALVWSAIHQLGVAWRSGAFTTRQAVMIAVVAGATALALVAWGPYPVAMVGVPGAEASNNSPPTIAMIAFGTTQIAGLLAAQPRMRRWLDRPGPWTATVLVNGSIMTLYLWHLTAMVLGIGAMLLAGGFGLGIAPDTAAWWMSRPVWLAGLAVATGPFLVAFGRFERLGMQARRHSGPVLAPVAATAATCAGLGMLAAFGVGGWFSGIRLEAVGLPLVAALWALRAGDPANRERTDSAGA